MGIARMVEIRHVGNRGSIGMWGIDETMLSLLVESCKINGGTINALKFTAAKGFINLTHTWQKYRDVASVSGRPCVCRWKAEEILTFDEKESLPIGMSFHDSNH